MPQRLPFGNRRRRYKVRNFSYFNLIFKFWVSFFFVGADDVIVGFYLYIV